MIRRIRKYYGVMVKWISHGPSKPSFQVRVLVTPPYNKPTVIGSNPIGRAILLKGEDMSFLSSRRFSLGCTYFNIAVALQAFYHGSIGFGLLCTGFAALCFYNYRNAPQV